LKTCHQQKARKPQGAAPQSALTTKGKKPHAQHKQSINLVGLQDLKVAYILRRLLI